MSFLIIITIGLSIFFWCILAILAEKIISNKRLRERRGVVLLLLYIISLTIASWLAYLYWSNSMVYKQIDNDIATKGIIFKEKILLNQYRLIGERNYVVLIMDEYTRSDRQFESILVIKKR